MSFLFLNRFLKFFCFQPALLLWPEFPFPDILERSCEIDFFSSALFTDGLEFNFLRSAIGSYFKIFSIYNLAGLLSPIFLFLQIYPLKEISFYCLFSGALEGTSGEYMYSNCQLYCEAHWTTLLKTEDIFPRSFPIRLTLLLLARMGLPANT